MSLIIVAAYVADTHAILWHLSGGQRLSPKADDIFLRADAGEHQILIPSIAVVEVVYLVEKSRVLVDSLANLLSSIQAPQIGYQLVPLDFRIARGVMEIDRSVVREMADRIIAATARALDLPLITRDQALQRSGVEIVW